MPFVFLLGIRALKASPGTYIYLEGGKKRRDPVYVQFHGESNKYWEKYETSHPNIQHESESNLKTALKLRKSPPMYFSIVQLIL